MTASPAPRRGPALAATVLDSTLSLLAERGYDFTVEDVASLAGVHKTTVYRRWATKPVLVAAAMHRIAEQDIPIRTPGGDPLGDLERLVVQIARALRRPAGANALRAALSMAGEDPHLRATANSFLAGRYDHAVGLLATARDRGSVRTDLDLGLVWQAIVNPLHLNAALGGPLDDDTARSLVRIVLDGATPTDGSRS